jgi:DNA processing protein
MFFEALLDRMGFGGYLSRLVMVGFTGHNRSPEASRTLGMIEDIQQLTPWFVNAADEVYPAALRALRAPPAGLWVRGSLPPADQRTIAIVGSRGVSRAGCQAIERIAGDLAQQSWSVISGGALGIDAAGHLGALEAPDATSEGGSRGTSAAGNGRTWAVLGCGIDVLYPDRHGALFERISRNGGLLSEYAPGTPPRAGQFPARNRIVAALAQVVLVGEAREGSGALITARLAHQLGRPIFAVPGSFGADSLLASGTARPAESAGELLEGLRGTDGGRPRQVSERPAEMQDEMEKLMARLSGRVVSPDVLASEMGLPLSRTLGMLSEAELAGWVRRGPGGKFEVTRGN